MSSNTMINANTGVEKMTEDRIEYWKKQITDSKAFRADGTLNPYWITTLSKNMDLSEIPGETVQEKVYVVFKNNGEIGRCKVCGKPAKFRNYFKGYAKTCSSDCKKAIDIENLSKIERPEPKPKAEKKPRVKKEKVLKEKKEKKERVVDLPSTLKKFEEFLHNRDFYYDTIVDDPSKDYNFLVKANGKELHVAFADTPIEKENYVTVQANNFEKGISDVLAFFGRDYEKEIQEIKDNLPKEFPYFEHEESKIRNDYKNLCKYIGYKKRSRVGDLVIQQFHKSVYSAKVGNKPSPYEAWNNEKLIDKCIRNRFIYGRNFKPSSILNGFNVVKIATKVSVFSSAFAKKLIHDHLDDCTTIFDPFSGFSGRMLGACSLGKKYIGQDLNEDHVKESNEIIKFLDLDAEVTCKDIRESTGTYDCLFTCPPYGGKEDWGNEDQTYKSCDDWIDLCLQNFNCKKYLFVVDETEKYKDYIVDSTSNKSHFSNSKERVVLITKN